MRSSETRTYSLFVAVFASACAQSAAAPRLLAQPVAAQQSSGARALVQPPLPPLTEALRERVERVARAFRERRGAPVAERWSAFLPVNESRSAQVTLARDVCVGFVAVGVAALSNIDLSVHDASGLRLVQDTRDDAHPYVRLCVRAATTLTVLVRATSGVGPVALLTIAQPPVVSPDLDAALGVRGSVGVGGQRVARAAIGADPALDDAPAALNRAEQRIAALGYRREGASLRGELEWRTSGSHEMRLEAGRCYGLLAVGEGSVDALELSVGGEDGRPVAQSRSGDARPFVRGCLQVGGAYRARVEMRGGAGEYLLQLYRLDDTTELPEDVVGEERAGAHELAAEARARAMTLRDPPIRIAPLGATYVQPVSLRAGRCYLLGAAVTGSPIEFSVADDHGAVLASETSGGSTPHLWHCPTRSMQARVTMRPASGRGELLFLAFESAETTR